MFYLQNMIETITDSNTIFTFVLLLLVFLSALLFYMIYSQNKEMVEELKRKKIQIEKPHTEETSIISLDEVIPKKEIKEEPNSFDLLSVTKELESLPKEEKTIELTSYEAEQEEKAIISYEELLAKSKMASISYSDESRSDDIFVKKVDLENTGKIELDPIKKEINSKVPVLLYEHEEEFLKALKQLQNLLN